MLVSHGFDYYVAYMSMVISCLKLEVRSTEYQKNLKGCEQETQPADSRS